MSEPCGAKTVVSAHCAKAVEVCFRNAGHAPGSPHCSPSGFVWVSDFLSVEAELAKLRAENAELRQTLAWVQRLPDLEWAEVCASIMQRLSMLARSGNPVEAQRLMAVLDKGKTYVNRVLAERDAAREHYLEMEALLLRCEEREREACARIADIPGHAVATVIAAAIRARSK